ncbi:MAG: XRE family transcriptional regulator [Clostridiales bacterium]|uniref:helix-turn-helix domain-containing protein n=1 Tax=Oscillospiraceae TaxID=216572 RepID=UPI0009A8E752|nr:MULTISPECIES: helix-turn-helix transcriptional regulator [Oscillospiraceae]PWM34792.1 MAG: XRE family transcriptional regulator [Clostridiales bacterium]RGB65929.1 XRE family transcriptional regulator [Harryflintia acetispora]
MDILGRIRELMDQRGMSEYKLSQLSGISNSTLNSLFRKNNLPTLPTLEKICNGLGVTMLQFMSEGKETYALSSKELQLFEKWSTLTSEQKELLLQLIENMK